MNERDSRKPGISESRASRSNAVPAETVSGTLGSVPDTKPWQRPCDYLGPILDQRNARGVTCRCPGKWLRRCELHGQCTLSDKSRSIVTRCTQCADYTADGAGAS
jgi:hypothetical protein